MKIDVIWEGVDIKAGVAVKDRDGCVSIIAETDDRVDRRWTLFRPCDAYVKSPMPIETLIAFLNVKGFVPKDLGK